MVLRGYLEEHKSALVAEKSLPLGARLRPDDPTPPDLGREDERSEGRRKF
jgi:hypothetical protein